MGMALYSNFTFVPCSLFNIMSVKFIHVVVWVVCPFLKPLYEYTTICFSILLFPDLWSVCSFCLLWQSCRRQSCDVFQCTYGHSPLFSWVRTYTVVELLGQRLGAYLTSVEQRPLFFQWKPHRVRGSDLLHLRCTPEPPAVPGSESVLMSPFWVGGNICISGTWVLGFGLGLPCFSELWGQNFIPWAQRPRSNKSFFHNASLNILKLTDNTTCLHVYFLFHQYGILSILQRKNGKKVIYNKVMCLFPNVWGLLHWQTQWDTQTFVTAHWISPRAECRGVWRSANSSHELHCC